MLKTLDAALRWLTALWSDSPDPAVRTYRRHVRGILTGWAVTATAMALIGMYPNELELSMYQLLLTQGLPWQQQGLAALEIAGPLVMLWHLAQLQRAASEARAR
jgi:hypothetical protein